MLNIVIAELVEGNYVLYQGDLSTKVLEKLKGLGKLGGIHAGTIVAWPWKISNNAGRVGPAKAGL
ncbi:MAG: phosphoenolpyruvate synthase [Pseudomonas sp.]|nr:MAG: phosphoenolpyruvate synthase [Pseudomonas sp.] [Pseudomonas sp. FEMGT703P]